MPRTEPKLKEGEEANLRVWIERIWPSGEITVYIKSAGQKVTLPPNASDLEAKETK